MLAVAAAATDIPGSRESIYSLKRDAEKSGLTGVGFGVALRRLQQKDLVEFDVSENEDGESYGTVVISDNGWNWIDSHESLFSLRKDENTSGLFGDDIPF